MEEPDEENTAVNLYGGGWRRPVCHRGLGDFLSIYALNTGGILPGLRA